MPRARDDSSGRPAAPASLCPTRLPPHPRSPSPHRHAHGDGPLRLPAQVGRHGARHAALRLPRRPSHATARHERRFYRVTALKVQKRYYALYVHSIHTISSYSSLLGIGHGRSAGGRFFQRFARFPPCFCLFCAARVFVWRACEVCCLCTPAGVPPARGPRVPPRRSDRDEMNEMCVLARLVIFSLSNIKNERQPQHS